MPQKFKFDICWDILYASLIALALAPIGFITPMLISAWIIKGVDDDAVVYGTFIGLPLGTILIPVAFTLYLKFSKIRVGLIIFTLVCYLALAGIILMGLLTA